MPCRAQVGLFNTAWHAFTQVRPVSCSMRKLSKPGQIPRRPHRRALGSSHRCAHAGDSAGRFAPFHILDKGSVRLSCGSFIFYLASRCFPSACLYRNLETRRFVSLLLDTVAVGDNQGWQRHTPSKPAPRRRGDVPKNIAQRSDVRASRVFLLLVTMSLLPRSQIAERRLDVRQRKKQHP